MVWGEVYVIQDTHTQCESGWTHFNSSLPDSSGESGLWEKPFCQGFSLTEAHTCMSEQMFIKFTAT